MKQIIKLFLAVIGVAGLLTACHKVADLPFYGNGTAPVLSASATTLAPAAADSNNTVLTLNWSYPNHATDTGRIKYTINIDSAGKNFVKAFTRVVTGDTSTSFTAKELNNILLGYGYAFNVPVDMDVRVVSSYANNNERLASNILRIRMTPYKIPPKVPLPTTERLFIVGSATQGGWNNPVPTPAQELTRIDETTFGGIFDLKGGSEYLILPLNGNWDNKFSVASNTVPGLAEGGDFGFNLSDNIPSPAAAGWYKIILDFQTGKFTVTPFNQQHGLPAELFIVGGATPGGWDNPVPVPAQKFTRINSTRFEIASIALTAANEYLLLPENGNWGKKFGVEDNTVEANKNGGILKPEGQNIPSPATSGNYKIIVDFINNSYKLEKL